MDRPRRRSHAHPVRAVPRRGRLRTCALRSVWRGGRRPATRRRAAATDGGSRRRTARTRSRCSRSRRRTRVPELVPIRYGRMLVSPFTFYRGAALIMAADLAATPRSGLNVQVCGDAHLSNFGVFASPERQLMFDINDFDETLPGPWEWDVKRLAASFEIAGRDRGFAPRGPRARSSRRRRASTAPRMQQFAAACATSTSGTPTSRSTRIVRAAARRSGHEEAAGEGQGATSPRPGPATACRRSPSSPHEVDGQRRIICGPTADRPDRGADRAGFDREDDVDE